MTAHPDETRITAGLPNLNVEMVFRSDPERNTETMTINLQATPDFQAAAGLIANPMLPLALLQSSYLSAWSRMAMLAWQPWLAAAQPFLAALEPPKRG